MEQKRVNLSLEKEVWQTFNALVPQRKKSKMINELLKKEIQKIKRQNEERILASAGFKMGIVPILMGPRHSACR